MAGVRSCNHQTPAGSNPRRDPRVHEASCCLSRCSSSRHRAHRGTPPGATRNQAGSLLIGVSALAVALAAAAATFSATPPKEAACGETLVIVLFWPHGHGPIPSVGFSADRKPHLEVYKYGTHGYPRANFLAYANASGTARFGKGCAPRIGSFPSGAIDHRLTARKARALSCRLPNGVKVSMRQIKRTYQVDIGTPSSRVASAKLRGSGSVLDFSRSACNPGRPPE